MLRPPRLIGPVPSLAHQPLKPQPAGGAKQIRPDLAALKRIDEDAFGPARQQAFEVGLAQMQRQLVQVIVGLDQDIKRAELDFVVMLAAVERVEIGDASTPSTTASPRARTASA